jgi:uncharacterized protein YqeY
MLREAFSERLKDAMKARDSRTVSTDRLKLSAQKERDVAVRTAGQAEPIPDSEILRLLQGMIKQRRESIALYEKGNRADLVEQERGEITVIESFLPKQLSEDETAAAVKAAIGETGAQGIKDMGRVMATLRERHAGVIDLARAGAVVRQMLG